MHIPAHFAERDRDTLYAFIRNHPLGTLVSASNSSPEANHLPFHLVQNSAGEMRLRSHVARANRLWRDCAPNQEVLVIFHGPNSYISPNLYPSKKTTGKAVPTWNYVVVHVRGTVQFKHDATWIPQLLEDLSEVNERHQDAPWKVSDAPAEFTERMMKAVVGLEIVIDDLVGNFKLSQNKDAADYQGVVSGLADASDSQSQAVAALMSQVSAVSPQATDSNLTGVTQAPGKQQSENNHE